MTSAAGLPPGQREIAAFPRFGLAPFAYRFPAETTQVRLRIVGDVRNLVTLVDELAHADRCEQVSDFHCVTTWTRRSLRWSGIRFRDFYEEIVRPLAEPSADATFVVLRAQDGYRSSLPLADLLAPDVMLADRLEDAPLSIEHGAPLRLIAPAHYGYKCVKHLDCIGFWRSGDRYRPVGFRFMAHPRARVANEERGRWVPGWLLRYLYRPLVRPTIERFAQAMQHYAPK
jgi:DMSO/TMAO reductase YedYZ molybdopterin-dependent catalytic subunit